MWGIKMDDLDHSMHIAEYDWTSFYEESEECGLLQPSLACPDISCLSDSEDSVNSSSIFSKGQQEPQPSPAANSDEAERNAACCCTEELQINPMIGGTTAATLQTVQQNVQSSDGDVQTESDTRKLKSTHEAEICNRAELHVKGPSIAHIDVSEDASSVASRAEKERWFVTVNDSPVRQRARAPPVKKKRRQKKTCKRMCRNTGQQTSLELGLELEINKDINDSEAGRGTAGGNESAEGDQTGVISDVSGEEDNLSEKVVISRPRIENRIDRNKHDPSSSAPTSRDTLTPSDSSRLDCLVSYELEDDVEFLSTHSYDSESYQSATESLEEPPHLFLETHQLQDSLSNNYLFNLVENTDAEDPSSCDNTLCNVTATNCEGYESTSVQPTLVSPSAGQHANKMPDVNSTCDKDTHSTLPCTPSDTPGPQNHKVNISASGCSSGDRLSLLPVPDLTVTRCPVADSPETYAKAAGHPRPVYAISAFWDEMEKLTINDILQLRMGRSTSPRGTQETVTPDADDFPTNRGSVVDTVEYNLPDGGLMDASDAADSDYFTQPDESKPGRSSCEFSTSDFEEDYWQFLSASRNPSPDPPNKNQQGTSDSPFSEEEESTASEGKETPVPSEDFAGQCFEHQDSNDLTWPRQITKSKSVRNVQALNTEDVSLQVLLGNDRDSLSPDRCPSLEETVLLNTSDSLGTLISAPFLSNTHMDMSEYFFTNRDARCVHDPEDIPVFDYTVCTFRDETSFSSLHDSQCGEVKPIPIFSCSHPTVRELTFPNTDYVFLIADFKEEDNISPIRVVSRAFIQGRDCGTPAAAPHGFCSGKGLLSIRKIGFHDKGSMWCGRSGAWVFPIEAEKIPIKRADPPVTVLTEGGVASTPSELFRELAVQRRILGTLQTTRREGIFSTLKQSDMCLVCIAFASWVLRSSDPEAADAWKAALLANVSALSAIQYLRHYVKKKKNPS